MKLKLPYSPRDFDPTPEDLVGHYLKNHILKIPYDESGTIQEETIYGEDIDPWDKFCNPRDPYPWEGESTSTPTLFLFTKLSDVGSTDKSSSIQKHRRAGCGTWHGTSSVKKVTSSTDERVIGHFRILSFRSSNGEETVGQWTMYEYGISAEGFPEILSVQGWQNQVVCKIKRDDSKANIGGKLSRNDGRSLPKSVPTKKKRSTSIIEEDEEKKAEFVNRGEEDEEKKIVVHNVGAAESVNHAIQEPVPNKIKRATSIKEEEDKLGVAEFVNHANITMRAASVKEEEEKKVIVHNVGVAEFVNHAIREPDQVNCSYYWELAESDSIDMDDIFRDVECN